MTIFVALPGLLAFVGLSTYLIGCVARDGYGTRPAPRSHSAELGTRADRELLR